MRFDDSLTTILAAGRAPGVGARSTWRQLVDLVARHRIEADDSILSLLRALRADVPLAVRAASARALAGTAPPARLVALLVEDGPPVTVPMVGGIALADADWLALLPRLDIAARAILRDRPDLPASIGRGLAALGGADFMLGHDSAADAASSPAAEPDDRFAFETDATGVIRWVDGTTRGALIGVPLALAGAAGPVQVDAVAAGAVLRRRHFADARLEVGGNAPAAGSWRLSGTPLFDEGTGRFVGYRGVGRRPRRDEQAERRASAADALRQLVHELRTPSNAIIGFAELIDSELLGPVPAPYRDRAGAIREQASALVGAIEDLDTAARIDGGALELRPTAVAVAPMLDRALADLAPLATMRGVTLGASAADALSIAVDDRAVERLVARLIAAAIATAQPGDHLRIVARRDHDAAVIEIDRPAALQPGEEPAADEAGTPLLGIDFTLRLARNLAAELGGDLSLAATRLILRLPADAGRATGQAAAS